ncbi:MAG TPA: DNA cytosine methyltransferase [Victivallis vadensis]|nr:DNA cytosine methyltransferase [Victivallis vadensis]
MRYASVCSGVEAASLAWMPLGWEPVWFSEIESFPCEVLKQRFPGVQNLGDMTKIDGEKYRGTVDLLVGGTPCQGFSVAGKQGGLDDPRSALCLAYCRLLETMRPRWFVWENVPGVFSTNGGEDFKAFLCAIDEIGYSVAWRGKPAEKCPDSHRYKACGNSMCVNVMRWIGMRIENVERKMR